MRKLLLILALCSSAFGSVWVQGTTGSGTSSPVTTSALGSNTTTNNELVVIVAAVGTNPSVTSLSVSAGAATFRKINACGTTTRSEVWVAHGITGGTTPTVSAVIAGTFTEAYVMVGEYTTANSLGASLCRTGTTSPASDTAMIPVSGSSLVVAGVAGNGSSDFTASQGTLRLHGVGGSSAVGGAFIERNTSNVAVTFTNETWVLTGVVLQNSVGVTLSGRAVKGSQCWADTTPPTGGIQCPLGFTDGSAGNLLTVSSISNVAGATFTVSDTINGSHSLAKNASMSGNVADIHYFANTGAGNTVVTIVPSAGTLGKYMLLEYNSAATVSPLDGTGGANTGTSTTPSVADTSVALHTLQIGACMSANSITLDAGWTNRNPVVTAMIVGDEVVTAAGTNTFSGTMTSGAWACVIASFKDASQPGGVHGNRGQVY